MSNNNEEAETTPENDPEEEADDEGENEDDENKNLEDAVKNPVSTLIGGDNGEGDNNHGTSSASELPTDVINDEEERKTLESNAYKDALKEEENNQMNSEASESSFPKGLKLASTMCQTEETFLITQPQPKEEQALSKTQPITTNRPSTARSNRLSRTRRSNYNPDDVNALSTKLVNGDKVECDDPDLLGASIANLEEQRDELINTGKYMESIKYQKAIDDAKSQHLDVIKKQISQDQLEELTCRKSENQEKYNTMLKDMKDQEVELEEKYNKLLQALKDKQEEELVQLENEYASEEKKRQYNRSSQRLRILRTQQALLIRTKRFDEALQVSKIADNLAQKETQQNHAHMLADFNQARSIIEARHLEEYNTFQKKYEDKRKELNGKREKESNPYLNRMAALQREEDIAKEPDRLWAKKRSEQNELTSRQLRKSSVTVKPNVEEFNTLPLPPLPRPATARKSSRSNKPG